MSDSPKFELQASRVFTLFFEARVRAISGNLKENAEKDVLRNGSLLRRRDFEMSVPGGVAEAEISRDFWEQSSNNLVSVN
jgi:hypothetical protein